MEYTLRTGQHTVSSIVDCNAIIASEGSGTWLYVTKDKSGSLHEAFAELTRWVTGTVDADVSQFLHELYIAQVSSSLTYLLCSYAAGLYIWHVTVCDKSKSQL